MRYIRLTVIWSFVLFVLLYGPSLSAAAWQAAQPSTIPPSADANEWGNKFLWALASSWLMRIWRSSPKLGGFTESTALWAQRLISGVVAFLNGLGISFAFDATSGQLVIGGLFLTAVLHGLQQFLLQEFVYHAAMKKSSTT